MSNNLYQLVHTGYADRVLIQCTANDLREFASRLISETRQAVEEKYEPKYYSIADLSDLLHVSQGTIYGYVRRGILSSVKIGGKQLFDRTEVRQAFARRKIGKYHNDPNQNIQL